MKTHTALAMAFGCGSLCSAALIAQQAAIAKIGNKSASYSGCVTAIPQVQDAYVLATENQCLLLQGKYDPAAIGKHKVVLRGRVTDAANLDPDTLHIEAITSISSECTRTCTLEPPGTRSLHNKEKPGKEGATQGVHDDHPPQR